MAGNFAFAVSVSNLQTGKFSNERPRFTVAGKKRRRCKDSSSHGKAFIQIEMAFLYMAPKKGESQTNILTLLRSYNLSTRPEYGMGGIGEYDEYRLDNYWLLGCVFNNNDYKNLILEKWKLSPGWRVVAVWPSTNFTGVWINYLANGQKFTEYIYTNGLREGEQITYYSDGSKSSVWHYENGKAKGLWTQYFPSSRIQIQCLLSNYSRIGDMVWFYENGSTSTVSHYDDGKLNGPKIIYFPSGKISWQRQYSNDVEVGLDIHYNEDGSTNSIRDFSKP